MFISLLLSACSSMPHGQTSPTVKPDISHVSYSGAGDFSQKVKFYGVDTTLTVALNNIIPDDWKYTVSSDINLNEKPVSWESDQAWIYTLGGVMQYYGVYARLDFVNKRAEISRKPIVKPVPVVKNSTDKTTVSRLIRTMIHRLNRQRYDSSCCTGYQRDIYTYSHKADCKTSAYLDC
ncbi:hypothetical protein PCI56_03490 [Plesiomonas shigelloides subsp. oncorhynchi]|nr:hypothetical protein [Plesiomonas shigelloides]